MQRHLHVTAVAVVASIALLGLSACSGSGTATTGAAKTADPDAKVTITVGDKPKADQPADVANFNKLVARFEQEHPNITIKASTESWDAQTFQAKLAGGTLPNVMAVSLTYAQSLIQNKQLPNMTPYLEQTGLLKDLNPLALKNVQDGDGNIYTVPTGLFSVGMAYNRKLFTEAGLDPDKPPTTWDEVRKDAKVIADKTGQAGYAQLTSNNTGGWMLSTMTYSMGGKVVTKDGSRTAFGPQTTKALQLLHDMRWQDDSMGKQFLYDQDQVRQAFSAGKIGMVLQAPDIYQQATHNYGMDPEDFGQTALPQQGGQNGTLTGGSLELFNVKSTPEQLLAALKWVQFQQLGQYFDKGLAVQNAKAAVASGNPVGLPSLPPVSDEVNQRYLEWVHDQVNVPLDQFTGYTSSKLKLIPEPPIDAQQIYGALDPVVQKVLTDEDVDIDATLDRASRTIDGILRQDAQ